MLTSPENQEGFSFAFILYTSHQLGYKLIHVKFNDEGRDRHLPSCGQFN